MTVNNDGKLWYRAVDFIGVASGWEPRIALQTYGHGPLATDDAGHLLLFESMDDLVAWGERYARYIIGLEPRA